MEQVERKNLAALSDQELVEATRVWQARYRSGIPNCAQVVSMYEDEMTRRFGGVTTELAPLNSDDEHSSPWWRRWLH